MQSIRPLDPRDNTDIDYKEEVDHLEADPKAAYIERDPRLANIADELAWAHGLSEKELKIESKKLLRKVSL
jgi:hypothetical protein